MIKITFEIIYEQIEGNNRVAAFLRVHIPAPKDYRISSLLINKDIRFCDCPLTEHWGVAIHRNDESERYAYLLVATGIRDRVDRQVKDYIKSNMLKLQQVYKENKMYIPKEGHSSYIQHIVD